jgi:hypothetical protein
MAGLDSAIHAACLAESLSAPLHPKRNKAMLATMRRLHPRGAADWGICVDAEGAMLGQDCVLVRHTPGGFQPLDRGVAAILQKRRFFPNPDRDRDWLFRQCRRIADALNKGEVALAQIYGLHIPFPDLDALRTKAAGMVKTGFDPGEPRIPKGNSHGGEWTTGGDGRDDDGGSGNAGPPDTVSSDALLADVHYDPDSQRDDAESGSASSGSASRDDIDQGSSTEEASNSRPPAPDRNQIVAPVADFSGGFHDTVVDTWLDFLKKNGIQAEKTIGVRVIGPNNSIVGYPDIIAQIPGTGLTVIEVKTGVDPTLTPRQTAYLPAIQFGSHIYSTDPRVGQLGLTPGVPFPPLPVVILYAPGPNLPYRAWSLPPPEFK